MSREAILAALPLAAVILRLGRGSGGCTCVVKHIDYRLCAAALLAEDAERERLLEARRRIRCQTCGLRVSLAGSVAIRADRATLTPPPSPAALADDPRPAVLIAAQLPLELRLMRTATRDRRATGNPRAGVYGVPIWR